MTASVTAKSGNHASRLLFKSCRRVLKAALAVGWIAFTATVCVGACQDYFSSWCQAEIRTQCNCNGEGCRLMFSDCEIDGDIIETESQECVDVAISACDAEPEQGYCRMCDAEGAQLCMTLFYYVFAGCEDELCNIDITLDSDCSDGWARQSRRTIQMLSSVAP